MTKKSFYYNGWIVMLVFTIIAFVHFILQPKFTFGVFFNFEKATSDEAFRTVMRQHNLTDVWMETFIYNDYILILAFTMLFYLSIKVIVYSGKIKKRSFLGIFSVIPGFFAALQNLLALEIINHNGLRGHFSAYSTVVLIKWVALVSFLVLCIVVLNIQITRLFRKTTAVNKDLEN